MIQKFELALWSAAVAVCFWGMRAVTFIYTEPPPPRQFVIRALLLGPFYVPLGALLAQLWGPYLALWLTRISRPFVPDVVIDPIAAGAVIAMGVVLLLNEGADWLLRIGRKKGRDLERGLK